MRRAVSALVALLAVGLLGGMVVFALWYLSQPEPTVIQGEVDAAQVDVSPKIPGRVATIAVREGETVAAGQVLATLESPEIRAKAEQASAAQRAAEAQHEKAEHGARRQETQAAYEAWQAALADVELADKTHERLETLFRQNAIPAQKLDEVSAKRTAATRIADAAKARYDMATEGAREEDRAAAEAVEEQAAGVVAETEAYMAETELKAPRAGEVIEIVPDPGELVSAGYPVVSIVDLNDVWVVFNVREDLLERFRMGQTVRARMPALGNRELDLKVDFVKALGDFAAWRATRASGDFDLRTFEVHARPTESVEGLRPGMTAVVSWEAKREPFSLRALWK